MKGLWAKKYAKMRKQQSESSEKQVNLTAKEISDFEAAVRKYEMERTSQVNFLILLGLLEFPKQRFSIQFLISNM